MILDHLGQEQLERALESADMRVVGALDLGYGRCILGMKYYPVIWGF